MRALRIDTTIRLADRRRLAFAEYGDPEGKPIMPFHGLPGSRLNTRLLASVIRRNPGRHIDAMQRKVAVVDRAVLARPGIRDMLVRDFAEALREGGQGMSDDMAANHGRPWGFALDRIETKVFFWYCALDRSVPPAMGRYLGRAVPESEFHLVRDAGHLWILLHLGEVLATLMRSGPRASARPGKPSDGPGAWWPAGSVAPEETSS